jgi:hypothetical protein
MLILEGTFSDDMITTGTSFQEDPCSTVTEQCQKKKEWKTKRKAKIDKRKKSKINSDPEI